MEIVLIAIVIVVIGALLFLNKKPEVKQETTAEAPYKVETPSTPETPVVEAKEEAKPVKKTAGRKPKADKPAAKKTAAKKPGRTKKSSTGQA